MSVSGRQMRGVAGLLVSSFFLSAPLSAQELHGTLRRATGTPASGVVVLAVRVGDGELVGRTVTGEQGTYRVRVSTDSLEMRALRIGQQPQTLGVVRLAAGEAREVSGVLLDAPVTIAALQTRTDSRCRVRPEGTATVARLFADARTALLASQLVSLDGRPRTRYRLVTERWNARGDQIQTVQATEFVTDSLRPFQSVPVDSLIAQGYVARQFDGSTAYRAPDAEVLVDDRFLADYCLHLVEGTDERAGSIGVGFRPARTRRGIVQVEGTLWLDRATQALQRLEYGYVGLESIVARTNPGGWVEFTELPGGIWFVSHWAIRMPEVRQQILLNSRDVSARQEVMSRQVVSGEVLEVGVNGRPRYTVGATDQVDESGAVIGLPLEAHGDPARCQEALPLVHGTVRGHQGTVLGGAQVTVTGRGSSAAGMTTRTDSAGQYRLCGVPADRPLLLQTEASGHAPDSLTVRVASSRATARIDRMLRSSGPVALADLRTPADDPRVSEVMTTLDRELAAAVRPDAPPRPSAPRAAARQSTLRVVDRDNAPVPFATVTIAADRHSYATDAEGRVLLDDTVSLSLPVRVQRIGYQPHEGAATRATGQDPFVVMLDVLPWGLDTVEAVAGRTRGAVVRIVDRDSMPIPYAMVTLGNGISRAADSAGRVLLGAEERLSLQVRAQRIGYQPHSGPVTRASTAEPFVITLAPLNRQLETVRTIAPRHTMLSRTGFYDRMERVRRGAILGEFILPEELELRAAGTISQVLYGKRYVTVRGTRLYGRAGCPMQILVDGKLMGDRTRPSAGETLEGYVHAGEVMAIEVYPSTANAPVELIPLTRQGSCGIVAVWTGPRQ